MTRKQSIFMYILMLIISSFFVLMLIIIFIPQGNAFTIITDDPFETLVWDIMCPRLNLSDNHCLLLLDRWANITTILNNQTIINNTYYIVNHSVINHSYYVTEEKTIVVNQTKIINQTNSKAYFDFILAQKRLDVELANIELPQEDYITKREYEENLNSMLDENAIRTLIVRELNDRTPPDTQDYLDRESETPMMYYFIGIIVIGGGLLLYMNRGKLTPQKKQYYQGYQYKPPVQHQPMPQGTPVRQKENLPKFDVPVRDVESPKIYQNLQYEKKPEDDIFGDEEEPTQF